MTIEKLRYLLSKATVVFGARKIGELTSQEIAEWRMRLSPGYRFEATQALRQVLHRAVAWDMPPARDKQAFAEVIDLDRVRRRDLLGGLILEYELAA